MEKSFKISDLKANLSKATDCIVIPDWILDQLLSLCNANVEYSGQLLCYKKIVEYVFISGSGTVGSVFPSKKVVFNNSPDYTAIEFHTHTSSLGDFWTDKFSQGDLTTFGNRLIQEGEHYQHILFTVKNSLTWGKINAPDIRIGFGNVELIMKTFWDINSKHNCWNKPTPIDTQSKTKK